jgi:TPP-dependent pyruvate/acetoin dehydrogenase alpha subunit
LETEGTLQKGEASRLEAAARKAIEEAVLFAEESPEPTLEEILQGVYA